MLRYLMTMFMSSRNHVRTQAGGGFFSAHSTAFFEADGHCCGQRTRSGRESACDYLVARSVQRLSRLDLFSLVQSTLRCAVFLFLCAVPCQVTILASMFCFH